MTRNPATKPKTGRKPLPIDPKVVEGMAGVGATDKEIGDFVGCNGDTIGRRFADVLTKSRSGMRTRLRQAQFKAAIGGNPAMLIWLGKQMLEQKDRTDLTSGDNPLLPQVINVTMVKPELTAVRADRLQASVRMLDLDANPAAANKEWPVNVGDG